MATKQPRESEQEKRDAKAQKDYDNEIELGMAIDGVLNIVGQLLKDNANFNGADLRKEIIHVMPDDIELAEKYNSAMAKMRRIGELISQVSNEEFLVRKSKS